MSISQTKVDWFLCQNTNPLTAQDLYFCYEGYQDSFGETSIETYRRYCREVMGFLREDEDVNTIVSDTGVPLVKSSTLEDNSIKLEVQYNHILSVQDLAKVGNIDTRIWKSLKIKNEIYGKNYLIKVEWVRKKSEDFSVEDLADQYERILKKKGLLKPEVEKVEIPDTGRMAEYGLMDFHYGQLSWIEESGATYDILTANAMLNRCTDYFIGELIKNPVDLILMPVGNDFFNSDTINNTTTAGTPQAESNRWQDTFVSAEEVYIKQINKLKKIAPIRIEIIPGNHDSTRIFFLGEVLRAHYRNDPNVTIDNVPRTRKAFAWGRNLLLYTHGNQEAKGTLPLLVYQEFPLLASTAKWIFIRKGHLHSLQDSRTRLTKETNGIRETIMPSLVPLDDWHKSKGYTHLQEAIMTIFDSEYGEVLNFHYHP